MSWHNTGSQMEAVNQDKDEGETYLRRKLKELYSSDQPRHECDGRRSDGRFLWTESTFNFQLAATTKYETQELWEENCTHIKAYSGSDRPKNAARIGLFFGAPGIGKTRTLLELKKIIPCGGNYAYISFNGGTTYSASEEAHATFDHMVVVRILYGSFESRAPEANFRRWLRNFDFKRRFSIEDCLNIIRSDKGPFCLAIDELTKIGAWAQYACDQITALVLTSPTIAFLGGTLQADWEDALNNSNIPGHFVSLAPFSNTQVNNILDQLQQPYAQYFIGWRANPDLRDILLRIGGVPRLLDQFVIRCEMKFRNQSPPWDWKQMDALLEQIDPHSGLSTDYLNRLVKDVILRREVSRRDCVIENGMRMTYDRLQSLGHIQLLRGHLKSTAFIFVPFLRFRQWVTQLTMKAGSRPFRILADLMRRKIEWGYWMDFEKVTAQYFQLLIHIWSEEAKEDPPQPVTWEEFFSTSIPGWPNDIKFIEESPEVITSMAQFPKCGSKIQESQHHKEYKVDNGFVFINAPSAPFADAFFTCRHGKEEVKCLVAIQCKLCQKTKMDRTAVNVEVKKNEDAMKSYQGALGDCSSMYTVILLSTPYSNCEEADEDEEDDDNNQEESSESMEVDEPTPPHRSIEPDEFKTYIVLGHEQLQKFFPQPLRDYTFRVMSSGRLNINCAALGDVKKLLKLTKGQAKKFAEERIRGGFKSKDDLPFEVNPDQLELLEF
jgi:hypothetical protein